MKKFQVQTYNNISSSGLSLFPNTYDISADASSPDAIILRSFDLHGVNVPESVHAVGRAGAGVNNIPVADFTNRGIAVFNTPGANANAVKELVIASLLLGCRHICQSWDYVRHLNCDDKTLQDEVEKGKKQFSGFELAGRTLGVIGLGSIGVLVANAAKALGMKVIGFDPVITVKQAWRLDANVEQAATLEQLLSHADFVTIHVPLNDETRHMINSTRINAMKKNAVLLNFARHGIIDDQAVLAALDARKLYAYINDFPMNSYKNHPHVISLPHLGASTEQSEENCAMMIVEEIKDYLEQGNITHSVNFPAVVMPWNEGFRLAIVNQNIPNMVGQISTILAKDDLNVLDLINKSRGDIAYTLIDVNREISHEVLTSIAKIEGVIKVRKIGQSAN